MVDELANERGSKLDARQRALDAANREKCVADYEVKVREHLAGKADAEIVSILCARVLDGHLRVAALKRVLDEMADDNKRLKRMVANMPLPG